MGNSIGNYVHWRLQNYKRFGVNARGGSSSQDAGVTIMQQHEESLLRLLSSKSGANSGKMTQYENLLNGLMKAYRGEPGYNKGDYKEIIDAAEKKLNETYEMSNYKVNYSNMTIEEAISSRDSSLRNMRKIKVDDKSIYTHKKTIEKRYNEISDIILKIANNTYDTKGMSVENLKQLKDSADYLNKNYENLMRSAFADSDLVYLKNRYTSQKNKLVATANEQANSILTMIENVNTVLKLTRPASLAKMSGDLAEFLIAATAASIEAKAGTEIYELMEELLVGSNTSNRSLLNSVDSRVRNHINLKQNFSTQNGIGFQILATQEKVDVGINYKDSNDKMNITAKNYNLSNRMNVSLVSKTSLMQMLEGESTSFANHFLNMTAIHEDEELSPYYDLAQRVTKETVAIKALTGLGVMTTSRGENLRSMDAATVFAINNKATGEIKFISTLDIAKSIIDNFYNTVQITGFPGVLEQDYVVGENSITKWERIGSLVGSLHSYKIHVSLKNSFITNLTK